MIITHRMQGQGYLLNDNTNSGGVKYEADVFGCPHCQAVLQGPKSHDYWCPKCFSPICYTCAGKMETEGCTPFMKQIEKIMETDHQRKQLSKLLGLEG